MTIGVTIKKTIGIGDMLQFSSLPENYWRETGHKLVDLSLPWIFDHNPFIERLKSPRELEATVELWNFGGKHRYPWPNPREPFEPMVYTSNAEIWAALFKVPARLTRPRLYRFENYPFSERKRILLQTVGKSHGPLPDPIIYHVIEKYGPTGALFHIGPGTPPPGVPHLETPNIWDLVELIASSRMIIGPDSGPSWIGACYPDVIVKKVRINESPDRLKNWIPLQIMNVHSHWDDRSQQIFNTSEFDVAHTWSYLKI